MVFCTYCGQSFTRDEHLERHILTHTNVKPFKCFTCHMSFARRDLLQRHYTVHGKDQNQEPIPAANGMIPKSAGRTPIACSNCAKTKTKCDKKFPCSRCAARNLRCTLRPTRRASKNAARMGMPLDVNSAQLPGLQGPAIEKHSHSNGVHGDDQTNSQNAQPLQPPPLLQPTASPPSTLDSVSDDNNAPSSMEGPPRPYLEQQSNGPTPSKTFSEALQTPGHQHSFLQHTPLSGFEDFSGTSIDSSDMDPSPRFMLDWSQMQIPIGYDSIVSSQMLMSPEMPFDPSNLSLGPTADGLLSVLPDMTNGVGPLITPIETPKGEQPLCELELGSSASAFLPHRPQSLASNASQDTNSDTTAIIAAQQAWSVFRCTPSIPLHLCPRTAKLNVERLERTLRNQDSWHAFSPEIDEADLITNDHIPLVPLHDSTRDKLLAITQSFLHRALDVHREGQYEMINNAGLQTSNSSYVSNFILLPPTRVLELFLKSYVNCSEPYFSLTPRGILNINELMHCYNERAASLLVLLMIAQGAMAIPSMQARMLTGGLIEACRLSLIDLVEKNVAMAADPMVLHSALLFTVQAAWSGDKWQMDVAMGQRGMYFSMLRHSGLLDHHQHSALAMVPQASTDQLWNDWIQTESKSRLVYSWVMVDQDLALFHDTTPMFSVPEFNVPMPDADRLWQAKSAVEWSSIFEQVHEFSSGYSSIGSGARPRSLRDLFRHFLDDEMISLGIEMTPLQLRLLLHPLQSLVCQNSQLLSCFSDSLSSRNTNAPRTVSASSTRTRLGEIQSLLQRWFDLAERYLKANHMCPMMQANLIIFHLVSLNAVTNFADIERLARREGFDGTYQQLLWMHKRCITDVEEAVFHCGQVLRLTRLMARAIRPLWWSAAIYRVALVLWVDSLTHNDNSSPNTAPFPVPGPSFAIDALPAEHPLIIRYLTKREGIPCVTKRDGSQMSLDRAYTILQHCIDVIDEGYASRLSDGIRNKLDALAKG